MLLSLHSFVGRRARLVFDLLVGAWLTLLRIFSGLIGLTEWLFNQSKSSSAPGFTAQSFAHVHDPQSPPLSQNTQEPRLDGTSVIPTSSVRGRERIHHALSYGVPSDLGSVYKDTRSVSLQMVASSATNVEKQRSLSDGSVGGRVRSPAGIQAGSCGELRGQIDATCVDH